LRHAATVEAVMRHFANELGYGDEADYWAMVGLMHDVDYGTYPDAHCDHSAALLAEVDASDAFVRSVISHGYTIRNDVEPQHEMERVLFAVDELTGLVFACALMRPSKSCSDMELSSLKKKYKDKKFAAGCSREIIAQGADMLGWDLDTLLARVLEAMQAQEDAIEQACEDILAQ